MKKSNLIILAVVFFNVITALPVLNNHIYAATLNVCDFVPCSQGGCTGGDCNALADSQSIIYLLFSLIFVVIIAIGIVMIIRGALKIIRSEGDDGKVKEGVEYIRGVMFGFIIIFVGIIGIVIISLIFGATNIFTQDVEDPPLVDVPII